MGDYLTSPGRIAKKDAIADEEESDEDDADEEGEHIFLDYTLEGSSKFANIQPQLGSKPSKQSDESNHQLMMSELDETLTTQNEYLKKKVELLEMEKANMHAKVEKLQKKLYKTIEERRRLVNSWYI